MFDGVKSDLPACMGGKTPVIILRLHLRKYLVILKLLGSLTEGS